MLQSIVDKLMFGVGGEAKGSEDPLHISRLNNYLCVDFIGWKLEL